METKKVKNYTNIPEIELKYKSGKVKKINITSSQDAEKIFREFFDCDTLELTESFVVIYLNRANKTLGWQRVSQGGITGTIVDKRLILATALKCAATGIILAHNHPSGNINPSNTDKELTKQLKEASKLLDIVVLDHLIISEDNYFSFSDEGLM